MCEGRQSRLAFILALLRQGEGVGVCGRLHLNGGCTVTDRRCTCGRVGVAHDQLEGGQGIAKCTSLSSTSALLECKCNADYSSRGGAEGQGGGSVARQQTSKVIHMWQRRVAPSPSPPLMSIAAL